GSRIATTINVRMELPLLFQRFEIKSVFDAPCGDFNWMRYVLPNVGVEYTGGDIVPEVVALARRNATDLNAAFVTHDIVKDSLPNVDLWICRDCLPHFSYANIYKALDRFCNSRVKYVLLTTHTQQDIRNRNIVTGDFRLLDLFGSPFNLTRDTLAEIDDSAAP